MCGIAGVWVREKREVSPNFLRAMVASMRHRGPDSEGFWTDKGIGLAHRRLSIIDLTQQGSQPFSSPDGRYVLVFNGEIYNYRELQEEYFTDFVFTSHSDTEVLLMMLIRFGAKALPKLRGMFAFALYDRSEHSLLLACDPFGKKPLYYTWNEDTFLFASEPKALFASGLVNPVFEDADSTLYLQHEYVVSPNTGYSGICIMSGGQCMQLLGSGVRIVNWWKPQVLPKYAMPFETASKKFDDLLGKAVERRMVADVPVGIFLSGGLDSSTIAWYMRRIKPLGDIHSCSVLFAEESFNEGKYAQIVADTLHTTHHSFIFTKETMWQTLRELIPLIDIPFADSSLLPTYAVSTLAQQYMKVVLGGDGADELLGGYGTFDAYELNKKLSCIPRSMWRVLEQLVRAYLPVSHSYFSFDFKLKSFLRGAGYSGGEDILAWLGAFTISEIAELLVSKHRLLSQPSYINQKFTSFDQASLYHIQGYLTNGILVKFDRATMAASLEARTPFLDVDLAEFVLTLPAAYKRHKRILKHVMQGRLPSEILTRKKQGFGIPIGLYFTQKDSLARHILTQERIDEVGVFRYAVVDKIMDEHERGNRDNRKKLWTLIMFQLWHEYWILGKKDVALLV